MSEVKVVRKDTPEFAEARERYLALFRKDQPEETVIAGMIGQKTTQTDKLAQIPLPFGCPDLELYVWSPDESKDGKWHFAWFCGRLGCLCAPCREDFEETYPSYCPDIGELEYGGDEDDYDPEYDPEWDEDW